MASNPMQRKARNSFLLGMFLMLIITGLIIAFLFMQLKNLREEKAIAESKLVSICLLTQDVKSGQIITEDMLKQKKVDKETVPNNAIGDTTTLGIYSLQDKEGNTVESSYDSESKENILYINVNNKRYKLETEAGTGNYYYERDSEKVIVELNNIPVVAKIDMKQNTLLTREYIAKGSNTTSDDVRKQEYNVIVLPTQLETGDYIDIRLSLPSGEDYIVISKKEATIPEVGGANSQSTVWMNLTESEILELNSAIVDAFRIEGSKLYATTYTEPGIQKAATPTYVVSGEVARLISVNPNIVDEAKEGLNLRYRNERENQQRENINSAIQSNADTSDQNFKTKMQESITKTQEERKKYLDGLSGN